MSHPENTNHASRIMTLDEYRKAHEADRGTLSNQPGSAPSTTASIDPDEQSKYRSFSPDYYAGIQAGMNRIRGTYAMTGTAVVAGISDAPHNEARQQANAMSPEMMGTVPTDELLDHNYDGIQEYDNPTPGWWYAIFVATILFGGFYLLVYHLAVPPLSVRHATAEARHLEQQFSELNKLETGVPKILTIMNEEAWLSRGEAIFISTCAVCHSPEGSGLVGPNLTDDLYRNIDGLMDISNLIITGTANNSMPSQRNTLNDNEIALVTAYVASLRGKNLPTGETVNPDYTGVPIAPWPTLDAAGNVVPAQPTQPAGNDTAGEQLSRAGD